MKVLTATADSKAIVAALRGLASGEVSKFTFVDESKKSEAKS
jgi:hypothetical protein